MLSNEKVIARSKDPATDKLEVSLPYRVGDRVRFITEFCDFAHVRSSVGVITAVRILQTRGWPTSMHLQYKINSRWWYESDIRGLEK